MLKKQLYSLFVILICALVINTLVMAEEIRDYKKPEEVVAWLYHDFSWEVVMPVGLLKTEVLIWQPRDVLERYFSVELASLILADMKCHRDSGLICNLEFSPLWDSQDPGAVGLRISKADVTNTVHVQFKDPANFKSIKIDFKVERFKYGWRITDIIYKDGMSLKAILNRPI